MHPIEMGGCILFGLVGQNLLGFLKLVQNKDFIMKNELVIVDSNSNRVIEDASELGKKYLKAAKEATNTKSASLALSVAERAFTLAAKMEKDLNLSKQDSYKIFLDQIDTEVGRPELWLMYLNYCRNNNIIPLLKGQFFRKLEKLDFKLRKLNGEVVVTPPGWNSRMKQII